MLPLIIPAVICKSDFCLPFATLTPAPAINRTGIVIKCNANQRYATTNVTSFLFRAIAAEAGVPVQNFVVRQVRA